MITFLMAHAGHILAVGMASALVYGLTPVRGGE